MIGPPQGNASTFYYGGAYFLSRSLAEKIFVGDIEHTSNYILYGTLEKVRTTLQLLQPRLGAEAAAVRIPCNELAFLFASAMTPTVDVTPFSFFIFLLT